VMLVGFVYLEIPTFTEPKESYAINELDNNSLSSEKEPLSFAVASDPHWGSERSNKEARQQILETIGSSNYDAFLCLGDISEMGSTESYYTIAAKEFQDNLNGMPLHVVLGNHDALINGTGVFKKYFQKEKENFYNRIDIGNLHIITLNLLWDADEFDKTQKQWLIEQLEEIPQADMTIVLSHCFGYSSGYFDQDTGKNWFDNQDIIENVDSLIEEYNVELMISGHNHLMELLKHENTHYSIIGTMGGILDSTSNYTSPQSIWMDNQTYGWLDIQAYENYLELTYKDQNGKDLYKATINNN
ncbi:MAG: metallophosphoesterase, partial [Sphaerochaetaceae bacterium]